ncbi:MAG: NCS2 family permease [Candidatus Scalindua sp. AMX11]|nr:MAG: NCS2 family permease [Candidatus Scalindua sp.]NOG83931.1 NCS2 family permease [Planctomycetota bacterium]RZV88107.1 MAG: NCS2 family permease [Candidatus Scalindua sp. SCAELEC01]TDE64171.1 MAG: NCS2 family permease [Candidatus Scalindua sp. AMX11]
MRYPLFVKRDIDGFFGLAIDNLIQLILIVSFCKVLCGMPDALVFGVILPGAAISILSGNIFYAWQAKILATKSNRDDITALPYGINTVSLFAFIFFIMHPVYRDTKDPYLVWKMGMLACFLSGVIEMLGALVGESLRRITPRAALLSTLAGIAITFISMDFALKIFEKPVIAFVPLAFILVQYFSKIRFPLGLPGGLIAIGVGTGLAWLLGYMGDESIVTSDGVFHLSLPHFCGGDIIDLVQSEYMLRYISVIVPMGVFNVVGSLQNIESAEAAGDKYNTFSSLLANGIGSVVASLFGSCFPTTIYIGHPGWKAMGARRGYSILNGFFMTAICFTGVITIILRLVPIEAGIGILLWIGIVIVAQAFQETPKHHAMAVAIGLFPAIAAWGLLMVDGALRSAGTTLFIVGKDAFKNTIAIDGMISLERGFIFTSMILASISVYLIERQFLQASFWSLGAAFLSYVGIIHAYELTPNGVMSKFGFGAAADFSIGYCSFAILFAAINFYVRLKKD